MSTHKSLLTILFSVLLLGACKENQPLFKLHTTKKVALGSTVDLSLELVSKKNIDSVQFFVNNQKIPSSSNTATINTTALGTGKHLATALVFHPGKVKKINNSFEVLAATAPAIYTYKILNTYPHDTKAYTQGLEFHNGFLYETTGKRGASTLRKVHYTTGKVLQETALEANLFGEGMTIFNNKIHWLTWKANKGFVYNLKSFARESEFPYKKSKQGWGLTHNETELIKSDGTHKIWFLDPVTHQEKRSIQVYTNKYATKELNELEYVNGKIYANKYQRNVIEIINPNTGVVEGIADLSGLYKEMAKTQKLRRADEVLNGIAFQKSTGKLFVTGKHWASLFEIELIQQ